MRSRSFSTFTTAMSAVWRRLRAFSISRPSASTRAAAAACSLASSAQRGSSSASSAESRRISPARDSAPGGAPVPPVSAPERSSTSPARVTNVAGGLAAPKRAIACARSSIR